MSSDVEPAAPDRTRAVVACTDEEIRRLLISVLRELGLQPVLSATLEEAKDLLGQEGTAIAFSQPNFTEGSFRDLVRATDDSTSKVPVIVCSEFYDKDLYIEAMAQGAFDYLAFPYRHDDVAWIINNAIHWVSPPPRPYPTGAGLSSLRTN